MEEDIILKQTWVIDWGPLPIFKPKEGATGPLFWFLKNKILQKFLQSIDH